MKEHRTRLDTMSLRELRQEAYRFRINLDRKIKWDREKLLNIIISHLEQHSPVADLLYLERTWHRSETIWKHKVSADDDKDRPVFKLRMRQVLVGDRRLESAQSEQQQQQFLQRQQTRGAD